MLDLAQAALDQGRDIGGPQFVFEIYKAAFEYVCRLGDGDMIAKLYDDIVE